MLSARCALSSGLYGAASVNVSLPFAVASSVQSKALPRPPPQVNRHRVPELPAWTVHEGEV